MFESGQLIEIEVERLTPARGILSTGQILYPAECDKTWIQCIYLEAQGDKHKIKHAAHVMVIDDKTPIREHVR